MGGVSKFGRPKQPMCGRILSPNSEARPEGQPRVQCARHRTHNLNVQVTSRAQSKRNSSRYWLSLLASTYGGSGNIPHQLLWVEKRAPSFVYFWADGPVASDAWTVAVGNSSPRKYFGLSFDPSLKFADFISGMATNGLL